MTVAPARPLQAPVDAPPGRERSRADTASASPASAIKAQAARTQGRSRQRRSVRDSLVDLIEPNWLLMAPIFAGAIVLTGISTLSVPRFGAICLALASVWLAAMTPILTRIERERLERSDLRGVLLTFSVGLPMLLFGLAISLWTNFRGAGWNDVLGIAVIVSTLATIILHRRVASIFIAQIALWAGVAFAAGSRGAYFALAVGSAVGLYLSFRQAKFDAKSVQTFHEQQRAQLRAEEILHDFEQTGQGWFWETDRRGTLVYVSPPICQLLERKRARLIGRPLSELFQVDPLEQENERTLAFHLSARSAFADLVMRAATPGEERWWSVNGRPLYDTFGNFVGFRGSGNDLTEKRRSAENASRLAHYDSLTGLANRLQMAQTLEKILAAPNLEHRNCAVLLLDLDRFKHVNDTMGHPAGDYLLTQVATRLERTIADKGRVGRLGGDEFQVVLPGRHRPDELAQLANRVIHSLSEPYSIDGQRVMIGASIGVALSPADGVTSQALIRNADLALYAAKDGGRGRHHFYAPDLHSDAEERRQLEQDLRDAISQGGFEVYYQPVVHTSTERITGFEALLRWTHPTLGPLSPAKFIPIAEDSGLITQIGEWVLRQACHHLAQLPETVRVAVNVSPLQFANPALPAVITHALAAAQVNPSRLELEITESVFLNDDEGTDAMFAALKRVGVRLSLDDFGTGYSSLGYLKKAPFDKIKIDQSFVRGATITGSRNGAIIASIVSLAEALGMETTAEGVETLDELDLVRMLGCSHVQGYIYAKPMSFAEACAKLQTGLTAIAIGPRAARASRHTMLRKVVLDHSGQHYHGTIRNISATGAMVEGLWNVPPGTIFRINLTEGQAVTATARWCQEDRIGIEFSAPLELDDAGRIAMIAQSQANPARQPIFRRNLGGAA